MLTYAAPIAFTLALWWASTVVILYLDGLDRRTFGWSLAGVSILLSGALWVLVASSGATSTGAAYQAFTCGLVAWAWQLMSFYMGLLTGPQKQACAAGCTGWARFRAAVNTSLYHELAVIVMAALFVVATLGAPNQFGVWTFVALWWMHQSAKLNVFFGVPNLSEELLPEHLRYLGSFMTRKPMNLFFPVSVSVSTIVTVLLAQKALADGASEFEIAGFTMLATLMALAVLEHWFLVAPLDTNALWLWGVKAAGKTVAADDADQATGSVPAQAQKRVTVRDDSIRHAEPREQAA